MSPQSEQDKIKEIEAIYEEFKAKLKGLQGKQNKVITDFLEELRERRLEELKQIIANS